MSSSYDVVLDEIDDIINFYKNSNNLNTFNNLKIFRNFISRIISVIDTDAIYTYQLSTNQQYIRIILNTFRLIEESHMLKSYGLLNELICSTNLVSKLKNISIKEIKISDIIFSNIINYSVISLRTLMENHNTEVITSYKRFSLLVTKYYHENTKPSDIKYFARYVIPKYHDYFTKSLQESPDKWTDKHNNIWYNLGKQEQRLMLKHLSWYPKVVMYAFNYLYIPFVPFLIHREILCIYNEKKMEQYMDILYCKYNHIYISDAINLSRIVTMLIKKQRMIKQAKHYLPQSVSKDKQYPLVKLWKLNFLRMFKYIDNLYIISNTKRR